ncbi:vanadium-dependent haloperoxidase [Bacillus sp. FJAT-49705]|uniref:Vanadium-dependent haloperoxidase n=1 Tax=Cytobacillus citreus TaxID=2833586 RepID=A0ABS5NQ01_9BACI|nr:vanadium-dependent haloperoxidase [Cytobacillus citreus]MBS4189488.1 vanadium-dependent haloperoxidase [Cytobacillus citreus]
MSKRKNKKKKSCLIGPLNQKDRNNKAKRIRVQAAKSQMKIPISKHFCNRDEFRYKKKIGSYTKGLPHNSLGIVENSAYHNFLKALKSGKTEDFELIPLGGMVKLANPQAAYAFDLVGTDSHQFRIAVPPSFSSAWEASEMAEVYWQALTRDVPFEQFDTNPLTLAAASDLTRFTDYRGPKINGKVTPSTLFRGETKGDFVGPYISQFLWKDIPYGATTMVQRYRTTIAGSDYMHSYDEWLKIQNGSPAVSPKTDNTPRYIRNGRDLGEFVHHDFSFQCPLSACLILLSYGKEALDPANPYLSSATQAGFITFGGPHILDLVVRAARQALEAAWFQKFLVHRRVRPEEFGGHVHNHMIRKACYPIHEDLLQSQVLSEVFRKYGTYLLPMAYPEGCPTHPAFPSGHACIAGAGITILKAFFNESYVIQDAVVPNVDGTSLKPYLSEPLKIGGELNKLASNIAIGRDTAGVHWRSDAIEGLKLGEAVATSILRDYRSTYNENFKGFTFSKFDGTLITI